MSELDNRFYTKEEVEDHKSASYIAGCVVGSVATFVILLGIGILSVKGYI